MKKKLLILLLIFNLESYSNNKKQLQIGFCITATNKYLQFVVPLIKSARNHFLKNHKVTYFVFTDSMFNHKDDTVIIYLKHKPWPLSTMQRFEAYYNSRDLLSKMDYVFACDADMLFLDDVPDEILHNRVAVTHPYFWNEKAVGITQYELNPKSRAYIDSNNGKNYYAGGFYGGTSEEFLKLVKVNAENIRKDLNNNFIAVWHDESHLNKYFLDNPPTLILDPSYCYPENYFKKIEDFPFRKILLARHKNYEQTRY